MQDMSAADDVTGPCPQDFEDSGFLHLTKPEVSVAEALYDL